MGDFNLPPGVTVGMLPGNGPEEGWEAALEEIGTMLAESELSEEDCISAVKWGIAKMMKVDNKKKRKGAKDETKKRRV